MVEVGSPVLKSKETAHFSQGLLEKGKEATLTHKENHNRLRGKTQVKSNRAAEPKEYMVVFGNKGEPSFRSMAVNHMEAERAIENTTILEDNNQNLRTQALEFAHTSDPPNEYLGMDMEDRDSVEPKDMGECFGEEGLLLTVDNGLEVAFDHDA